MTPSRPGPAAKLILSLAALVVTAGCDPVDKYTVDEDTDDAVCELQAPALVADDPFPGHGHRLLVRVGCQAGGLPADDAAIDELLSAKLPNQKPAATTVIDRVEVDPGLTLVLLRPRANGDRRRMMELARRFIEARPASEPIAVYAWGDALVQLSDFRLSRSTVTALLARLDRLESGNKPLAPATALAEVSASAAETGGPALRGLRSVVVISDDAFRLPADATGGAPVELAWAVPASLAAELGAAAVAWDAKSEPKKIADELSARLDAVAARGFVAVGICGLTATDASTLSSGGQAATATLTSNTTGATDAKCVPSDVLAGDRKTVQSIGLTLDDEGKQAYQDRLNELDRLTTDYRLETPLGQYRLITQGYGTAKDDLPVSVSLGADEDALSAQMHIRGQGASFCERKSFNINIDSKTPRFLAGDSQSDKFYAVAGCEDPGVYGFVGYSVFAQQEVFPLKFHYIDVSLDGANAGAYLLVEHRKQELLRDHARLRGIVRRRYETYVEPDVTSVIEHDDVLRAAYDALLGDGVSEADYADYLKERLDVDSYLRWIAVNSLLSNSDSIDESIFIATESIASDGTPTDYFHFMGWDPQLIFTPCDPTASSVVEDPHGLSYCQRAKLDARILGNETLYARYIEVLTTLLETTTETDIKALMDQAHEQLATIFAREATAAAMQLAIPEDGPWAEVTDETSAIAHLISVEEAGLARFRARREELQNIIDAL